MNKFLFICKASTSIGLGHLMRSKALALNFKSLGVSFDFFIIGTKNLHNLISTEITNCIFLDQEQDLIFAITDYKYECVILDLLHLESETFKSLKKKFGKVVSISPIFNFNSEVSAVFSRTKYTTNYESVEKNFIGGLKYTIINENIIKQNKNTYIKNLNKKTINIGVAMGGGDAANRTLAIINQLKLVKAKCTIWAMLGEGYKHSLDEIIEAIESDSQHEIILAKNNRSMWQLLGNCSFIITTSGITSYEAVYVGIPSITFYENENQYFLIKELLENDITINGGIFKDNSINKLSRIIDNLLKDKQKLITMHLNTKKRIGSNAGNLILEYIKNLK